MFILKFIFLTKSFHPFQTVLEGVCVDWRPRPYTFSNTLYPEERGGSFHSYDGIWGALYHKSIILELQKGADVQKLYLINLSMTSEVIDGQKGQL